MRDLLATMPEDWLQQLHLAASRCSDTATLALIKRIPSSKVALTKALDQLVQVFQFDKILQLIDECRAVSPGEPPVIVSNRGSGYE
jgi:hypothetical protein